MLAGEGGKKDPDITAAWDMFRKTSVYKAARQGAGRAVLGEKDRPPSYLSARGFADAVLEMIVDGDALVDLQTLPANLRRRLDPLVRQAQGQLIEIKAGLESWFDETMERAEGAYKRWVTALLFAVGLGIAAVGNASTVSVADDLWHNSVVREAVVDAAGQVAGDGPTADELDSVAEATSLMEEFSLPVGWDESTRAGWDFSDAVWTWERTAAVIGWLLTALLVMLGSPFWFDLLSKFVSLRTAGAKPPSAADDKASATTEARARADTAGAKRARGGFVDVPTALADALGVHQHGAAAASTAPKAANAESSTGNRTGEGRSSDG
jgi:hypothetical protein